LLVLQSFLLLVQFVKLETNKVFAGRRSLAASACTRTSVAMNTVAMVSMSGRYHLALLLRRLLLMVVRLLW